MTGPVFVDTNVLVYARDASEGSKQRRAAEWMTALWRSRRGRVSTQVLQEFYVTVTRKLKPGLDPSVARADVRSLFSWRPVPVTQDLFELAWKTQDRFGISWWDSLVVAAAEMSACALLLSEDLGHGRKLGRVEVVDPFRSEPPSPLAMPA